MPNAQCRRASGKIANDSDALPIRLHRVRCIDHVDERRHVVVDVAADRNHARGAESDATAFIAAVETQLERPGGRKRIDVVTHRIEIWKRNGRARRCDKHKRIELHVLLGDTHRPRKLDAARRRSRDADCDHSIGHRAPVDACDPHAQVRSLGQRRD